MSSNEANIPGVPIFQKKPFVLKDRGAKAIRVVITHFAHQLLISLRVVSQITLAPTSKHHHL